MSQLNRQRSCDILGLDELRAITGYSRSGDIARCLRTQGIRFFYGRGGEPWTTTELVNLAGGLNPNGAGDSPYPPDAFR
jgi:hypothetical protein